MTSSPPTPEALLGRNDSRNPATTCKGITNSGRPCRRQLASSKSSSITKSSSPLGIVTVIEESGTWREVDYYCWQHKDQAQARCEQPAITGHSPQRLRQPALHPLQERNSIDTLVQRLGIEAAQDEEQKTSGRAPSPVVAKALGSVKTTRLPEYADHGSAVPVLQCAQSRPRRTQKKHNIWTSLCCLIGEDDDYFEVVRHRKHERQRPGRPGQRGPAGYASRVPHDSRPPGAPFPSRSLGVSSTDQAVCPLSEQRTTSNPHTGHLLSLIPQHCSPPIVSTLLAELVKPISRADEEGYIYIFWLTPQSKEAPEETTARSLLTTQEQRLRNARRLSDVMTEYSFDGSGGQTSSNNTGGSKTIMLKIGRANNITRRMNEWQRQCGHRLNLVRWYPYVPVATSPPAGPSPHAQPLYPDLSKPPSASQRQYDVVRKVPCVKRVERLIHLELAEQRVLRNCDACGKEHREWFEVEASQAGVKAVDECVRKWVKWAEDRVDA